MNNKLILTILVLIIPISCYIILYKAQDKMEFFCYPSEIEKFTDNQHLINLGGHIVKGSVKHLENQSITFEISDGVKQINVLYNGILPALFGTNTTIVARGNMNTEGTLFISEKLFIKHDQIYAPKKEECD